MQNNPKKTLRWKRWLIITIVSAICLAIVVFGLMLWSLFIPYGQEFPHIVINSESTARDISEAFMYRLLRRDKAAAQELVIEDAWPKIDRSLSSHPITNCRTTINHDVDGLSIAGGGGPDPNKKFVSLTYHCFGSGWIFLMDDVELERVNGEWKIFSWKAQIQTSGIR